MYIFIVSTVPVVQTEVPSPSAETVTPRRNAPSTWDQCSLFREKEEGGRKVSEGTGGEEKREPSRTTVGKDPPTSTYGVPKSRTPDTHPYLTPTTMGEVVESS